MVRPSVYRLEARNGASFAGLAGAHALDGFRRAHNNRVSPETKIRVTANRRRFRRKTLHRFPLSVAMLAYRTASGFHQDDATGDVPNVRAVETRNPQHTRCDQRTFDRRRTRLAGFPILIIHRHSRHSSKAPPYGGLSFGVTSLSSKRNLPPALA